MKYWLIKSEENCYSISDLKKDKKISWEGVRNFQARNFMTKEMSIGDLVLFYHSNGNPSGVVGIAEVCSKPHIDMSALNKTDEHFDSRATKNNPIWFCVDFKFVKKFEKIISLETIKKDKNLESMIVARKGNRLSITPVLEKHFSCCVRMGR